MPSNGRLASLALRVSCVALLAVLVCGSVQAAKVDWTRFKGTELKILLNKHPMADALIAELPEFTKLTGIKVKYDLFPEEEYFDKVTLSLASRSSEYDAFMTGVFQLWKYASAGWVEPLDSYINDSTRTDPAWDKEDIYENLMKANAWDLVPGHKMGTGKAKQWALPWIFHTEVLIYWKDVFEKHGLPVPKDLPQLVEVAKKVQKLEPSMYGIAVRGSRSWATIHPGFLSAYTSYGAVDFDEKLNPKMNSPEAVEMTKLWIDMVKAAGPKSWTTYTWYEVGQDFGSRKAAMMYDADIIGWFQTTPENADKIAYALPPGKPGDTRYPADMWIWSLAMNSASRQKDATWLLLQWATGKEFTLKAATEYAGVDPVRKSVWEHPEFQEVLKKHGNYYEIFKKVMPNCAIYFTPQPLFFEATTEWSVALHRAYSGEATVEEALNKLVNDVTKMEKSAGVIK